MALTPEDATQTTAEDIRRIDELEIRIDAYLAFKLQPNTNIPARGFEFRLEERELPLSPGAFAELRRRYAQWDIRQGHSRNELLF